MDHAVLVDIDVRVGSDMLEALARAGKRLSVALWATFENYYDPRFVFAAPWLDQRSQRTSYGQFGEVLRSNGFSLYREPALLALPMNDPFNQELRTSYSGKPVEGMRLSGPIGGRHLLDGYVYHIE